MDVGFEESFGGGTLPLSSGVGFAGSTISTGVVSADIVSVVPTVATGVVDTADVEPSDA